MAKPTFERSLITSSLQGVRKMLPCPKHSRAAEKRAHSKPFCRTPLRAKSIVAPATLSSDRQKISNFAKSAAGSG
eukprot:31363-Alexandrium_andersonii.AAC.1